MCIFDTIFLVIIMDKITIFLIRHSEQLKINTLLNNSENSQIANEKIILSVEGEKKAEALSKIKELSNLNSIWSSTYVRALATAKYIAERNNLEIQISTYLNERKIGNLDSLSKLRDKFTHTFTTEQLLDENLKNKDGENRFEVNRRMTSFINKLLAEYTGSKIAIVSHGASIKFLLMNWCSLNENFELFYKNKVLKAKDIDSVVTGRSHGHPARSLRNNMTRQYVKMENEGAGFEELEYLTLGSLRKAVQDGDTQNGSFMAGQIAGLIHETKSCKEIIEEMENQAEKLLKL